MRIGAIVWGVTDIARAVDFWSKALDYHLKYPMSDDWAILIPSQGHGMQLSLSLASSSKAQRHHMDLFTENQMEEVERLISLGATRAEWRYEEDADYVVLKDPDGNPFCIIQDVLE